jgi:DNA repair protein RadA/Sms
MELVLGQPKVDNDTNILDVEIPPEMENAVSTGHQHLDVMFAGDGLIPSTCALVTGLPGAGKTTLMLQTADSITGEGHICVYNTGEESLFQVRRTTKRLGLRYGFIPSYHRCVDDIIQQLREIKEDNPGKQIFFIQDSLQCLEPSQVDLMTGLPKKGRPKTGLNAQVEAVNELLGFIKEIFGIWLLIGQVTKSGDFAGKNAVKHALDCHLHLGIDTDKKSETYGQRVAEMQKNRFGPAGLLFGFELTARGLQFEAP